nr:protein lingerer isoform X1 [Onthophagus taurus]XP_022907309.1 protein lingerer isoform X1 [Onthophagus taurus]XP_022907310.1 protein lingerer isoform X1 [Onthophagus taurus]XP_022907311.1 protein lingerer isoform X1 [Onthophagus taurus]XP_022907312.1 protein lingerer isoform X2 [Onthophagus taurus]
MSSSNRTTSKGGKGPKADKSHKNEKGDTGKGTNEKQQGGGGGDSARSKSEDPTMRDKVKQVMEFTQKTEEDVCMALHECDNDMHAAMNMLLDDEWGGIMVKKKKSKQPASSKTENADAAGEDWNDQGHNDKEKPRNKSGGPPRHHRHNDSRLWRGREKAENERNLEGGNRTDNRGDRRGRSGGPTRGGPGRGRGGSRVGSRYPPRTNRNFNNRPIDTWDNNPSTWDNNTVANHTENWDEGHIDEWSTEEYTGSLADTKVFTPSIQPDPPKESPEDSRSPPLLDERTQMTMQQQGQLPPSQSPIPMVGTLNAAQTQYLNQLTQQNADMKSTHLQNQTYGGATAQGTQQYSANQYGNAHSNAYASTYNPVSTNYGTVPENQPTQQPIRTKTQRARVPPPSKIPSSAVEMPGDLKSIGLLDVQFGAMDLISDGISFDAVSDAKFNSSNSASMDVTNSSSSNIDLSTTNQTQTMESYATQQKTNAQSSISSSLTQSLTSNDNIPQTSEHITTSYSTATRSNMTGSTTSAGTASSMEINKPSESHSYSQSSTYNSYQPKSSSYQSQNYNAPSYSSTQTTSSYGSSQPNNYVSSNTGSSYNAPASNAYQNNTSASSYQSNYSVATFPPSITQASSYPTNNQTYSQNANQSVYGSNSGLTNSSNYGNATTSPQYNSYSSNSNHKLVKDNTYDSATTVATSTTSTTSVSTSTTTLSLTQTTATTTKTTTLAKNSSGVVSSIPPGVAPPVMSTPYLMSQGIPYFQPPIYTYEDMQLLPHRLPHMTTPFYEMSYQTPTTMTAVRDQPLSTYTMSDARFTRGDNNASPVPSTLSQQTSTLTQGHQGGQPILAQTPQTYFFAAPYSPMQSYQFGAVYGQIPTATNAHGSSNNTQYAKPYGSGYGSAYDTLSQSQDYTKGGYVGNTQGQTKGSGANASSTGTTGNDLSAMYNKSHTAIGKVNSYDKQGFHSGTPPPFSGTLHGSQNAGLAPSGSGYAPQMYIPTMPPHQQHHSTQLMHQQLHQMDVRQQGRRMDSGNTSGQRSQASNQAKSGGNKYGNTAYWTQP